MEDYEISFHNAHTRIHTSSLYSLFLSPKNRHIFLKPATEARQTPLTYQYQQTLRFAVCLQGNLYAFIPNNVVHREGFISYRKSF